jgi:hypothetical protein
MNYDIVLIFTSFRKCGHYLSIVKKMSSSYNIGIYLYPLDKNDLLKLDKQNKVFLELIYSYGAKKVLDDLIKCKIMLIPQWHYHPQAIKKIFCSINSKYNYWFTGLGNGNSNFENLDKNKIHKVLVVDRKFYDFRLHHMTKEQAINLPKDSLVEVGTPFMKYPIFDALKIDYIIANPTPYSFPSPKDRVKYMKNVLSLLNQIPLDKNIVYKPHNAYGVDSLVNQRVFRLMNSFSFGLLLLLFYQLIKKIKVLNNINLINKICIEIEIVKIQKSMLSRVKHLKDLTKYHDNNLEIFLPHVSMGLITGRSNSIWHAFHAKLPVFNCIPNTTKEISKEKMHAKNMRYYNLQSCEGNLKFDKKKINVIEDKTRKSNIIDFLKNELEKI